MSWERDYYLNGVPLHTGYNTFKGAYEHGSLDQESGKSFPDALRDLGLPVVEGASIDESQITLQGLVAESMLVHGPENTPSRTEHLEVKY